MELVEERTDELVQRAMRGDASALAEVFDGYCARLRQMLRLRLDRRLQGRVDLSDVLQETYIDLAQKMPTYAGPSTMPFFLWLRLVASERLLRIHRHHLGAAMRDAGREISLYRGATPQADSQSLANHLTGQMTSASQAAERVEMQLALQQALDRMEPLDREIIALRHFEELGNDEVAAVLGISKSAASKRYVRAMVRLKASFPATRGLSVSAGNEPN